MDNFVTDHIPPNARPSAFAAMGQPCCSRWGKSELEWLALAYVQALANGGDTWRRLSKEETLKLLTAEQQRNVYGMLTRDFYDHWFESVREQITDADGAWGVGGFWNAYRYQQCNADSATAKAPE